MNIGQLLQSNLPAHVPRLLGDIGEVVEKRGEEAYVVGGVLRDLLLERPILDLDLVIEGEAISIAQEICKARNWELKSHPHFGTAKVKVNSFSIDFVTARSEAYPYPGALPKVTWGNINDDLFRRDFTINAMAAYLSPKSLGDLLDPYGGYQDLEKRLVRVLHPGSFSDDPTRILRAIRYEQRFDFHLQEDTKRLMQRDMRMINNLTGERLWHELELVLEEESPEKVLCRAQDLGVLQYLCPPAEGDIWLRDKFARCRLSCDQTLHMPQVYLCLLLYRASSEEIQTCISRLKMPGWAKKALQNTAQLQDFASYLVLPGLRPSHIYRKLKRVSPETIEAVALASDSPVIQEQLRLYLDVLRYIKPSLKGNDLKGMGIRGGKQIGQMLRIIHDARLNGEVVTRDEEEKLVRRFMVETNE